MVCKKLIFLGCKFALWVMNPIYTVLYPIFMEHYPIYTVLNPILYGIIPYFYGVIPYLYEVVVYKYHIDTIFLNYRLIIGRKIFLIFKVFIFLIFRRIWSLHTIQLKQD